MSVGKNLQEMENVVTKGAKAAEPMHKLTTGIPDGQTGGWEDLGGPTPQNYRPDDDSAKLNTPGKSLAQVRNVVNKGAKAADAMKNLASGAVKQAEDVEYDEEELLENPSDEEALSEEELSEDEEVVAAAKKKNKKGDDEEGDDEEGDDEEGDDEDAPKKKKVEEDFDIEEDVNALLAGEDLSEEFQEKARTIFEAAIRSRVAEIKQNIEEQVQKQYEESLIEEVTSIRSELIERVDSYLEYVADEWVNENSLAIEHGLKTEMTESFLQGMKSLFEDHYVTIPEDRYDVLESMVEKLDEMETKLNEQIERNVALNRRLAESVTEVIFAEVSEGLALSQKDKLASLAENVEFDGEANYREKLVTLRESYFPKNAGTQRDETENLNENVDYSQSTSASPSMENYLRVLGRVSNK